MTAHGLSLDVRFWAKVNKTETCWLRTGATTKGGYGNLKIEGAMKAAHRVAYELARGPIPEGMQIDHLCRVRNCVNPAHLEAVSQYENMSRGEGLPAQRLRMTHCKRGHPFDLLNTYEYRNTRICRACRAAYGKARSKAA